MKVGRAAWWSDVEVHLPSEIIELILTSVHLDGSREKRQHLLWSCCLVSKAWYSAAAPLLYHAPVLTGRNFTEFARTISPPLGARAPLIGLEDCIHHLDMGSLAYEPTKSTTARLIRRTKHSLETFVSPAASFSVNCLAPLSKCSNLKTLDLSKDIYDIELKQLLSSIAGLEHLLHLSLPRGIVNAITSPESFIKRKMDSSTSAVWPPNLSHLSISNGTFGPAETWAAMMSSWPTSLHTLILTKCDISRRDLHLDGPDRPHPVSEQITTLVLDNRFKLDIISTFEILAPFPRIQKLSISAITFWEWEDSVPEYLEHLILQYSPSSIVPKHHNPRYFLELVKHCPNLVRVDVPEAYFDFEADDDGTLTDEINAIIEQRVEARAKRGKPVKNFGVILEEVDDNVVVCLKESLPYPMMV